MTDFQYYKDRGSVFIVGSHMYGLNTPTSDIDELTIYWDPTDHVSIFKQHPDVLEVNNNDTKLFSLQHFAYLLAKGNPNLVEVVALPPQESKSSVVGDFMRVMAQNQDLLMHKGVVSAYRGHLTGIEKEIKYKGLTAKRLSHALRVLYSLTHLLEERELFIIRDHETERDLCASIKQETNPEILKVYEERLGILIGTLDNMYPDMAATFPSSEGLKVLINNYFRSLYARSL